MYYYMDIWRGFLDKFIKSLGNLRFLRKLAASNEAGIGLVLILMIGVISVYEPNYVSVQTIANLGQRAASFGIIALGMVFLLSMGEIDLSVGSIYGFTICLGGVLIMNGLDPWMSALTSVIAGVILGAVNGIISNALKIPTIITTLGTMSMYRGLTLILTRGTTIWGLPRDHAFFLSFGGKVGGLPVILIVFTGMMLILSVLYRSTRYGFVVRAIGSNPLAARLSGVPIEKIRLITLMIEGGLCGIAGVLTLAFFATGDPTLGSGYELQAIAAAIVGGTALSGGRGTVLGAFIGAFIIAVISSGIIQFGVSANWSVFVTGAMIIFAVSLDSFIRSRRKES